MKLRLSLLCLLFLSAFTSLHASETSISCHKTYFNFDQLSYHEKILFVEIDNLWIQPTSVQADTNGLYFDSIRYNEEIPGPWQCKRRGCVQWNEEWRVICKKCGFPKGSK